MNWDYWLRVALDVTMRILFAGAAMLAIAQVAIFLVKTAAKKVAQAIKTKAKAAVECIEFDVVDGDDTVKRIKIRTRESP